MKAHRSHHTNSWVCTRDALLYLLWSNNANIAFYGAHYCHLQERIEGLDIAHMRVLRQNWYTPNVFETVDLMWIRMIAGAPGPQ
jgi:hypothetical protein